MPRPTRAAGLVEALTASVSARVSRRVTDTPELALTWAWSDTADGVEVRADDVVVRITGPVATDDTLVCSCLMAPKCVHRLAVASVLAPDDAPAPEALPAPVEPTAPATPLSPEGAALAGQVRIALAGLVQLGAHRADALVRAGLTRLAWEARAIQLPRLGRALTRVVQSLRLYEAGHPTFALSELVADVTEALELAVLLPRDATADRVGEARRSYQPVGALRLVGLVSEPVISAGSAGVVTHMLDPRGRRWEVPDVRPRAAGQAVGVYDVAPPLSALPHRQLAREGLFVQGATAAGERLGAGASVEAVRANGARWEDPPIAALWEGGHTGGLRFVRGAVLGLAHGALWLDHPGGPIALVPGHEHSSLPWRDNLRLLARAPGLTLSVVGRPVVDRPRALVALGAAGDALTLPEAWAQRACLGLDRLTTAMVPTSRTSPAIAEVPGARHDPIVAVRRRVERMVLGGASSLPGEARAQVDREAHQLAAAAAAGGAALLVHLADAALVSRRGDADALAGAWLATAGWVQRIDSARANAGW